MSVRAAGDAEVVAVVVVVVVVDESEVLDGEDFALGAGDNGICASAVEAAAIETSRVRIVNFITILSVEVKGSSGNPRLPVWAGLEAVLRFVLLPAA